MNGNQRMFSVIVPMYNCQETIDKCIHSVQTQTVENWELLLIDDGSKDNTFSICKRYATSDERIVVLHKENGGPSSARNYGIDNAKGKYLLFLDSDDSYDGDYLFKLLEIINKESIDTVFCGYKALYENGEVAETIIPEYENNIFIGNENKEFISRFIGYSIEDFYAKLNGNYDKKREFSAVWRFCYSTEIVRKNNVNFDESVKFGEDILFNSVYLAFSKKIFISDITSYNYLYNPLGLVQKFLKEDGIALCNDKIELLKAREKATDFILKKQKYDLSKMWEGSVLFSVMHIGITLANTKGHSFGEKYSSFISYAKSDKCKEIVKKLRLKKLRLKYAICYIPIKSHMYLLQYFLLKIASILNVSAGVED